MSLDAEYERRVLEVAAKAGPLEQSARVAYLDDACADDAELRRDVERLLAAQATKPYSEQFAHGASALPTDTESEGGSEIIRRLAERRGLLEPGPERYRMSGEVARGGQGAIFRVWDEDLQRHLAMKVVLGQGESDSTHAPSGSSAAPTPDVDPRTLGRFLDEAQVTGQLDHPGIVPVHELGLDAGGRVYFTMKLVKGRTLREVFGLVQRSEEGWSTTRALGVLLKVCEAMSYAHSKGVIHRDLKPANIMVGRFGEVYVMDWGLARILDQEDKQDLRIRAEMPVTTELRSERKDRAADTPESPLITMDGDVVGTPSYMSPEQARGELDLVGLPTDVYAVGAILYQLLSGRVPYVTPGAKVNGYALWQLVQMGPPQPIGELAREEPAELLAICEKAMAREPMDRYPDMGELAEDLRAYLEGRVVRAYRTGPIVELRMWVVRNKGLAASLAAAILLLVGGFATSLAYKARSDRNAELAEQRAVHLKNTNDQLQTQTVLAERRSYMAFLKATQAALDAGHIREARRLHGLCPLPYRNWEWHHLGLGINQSLMTIEGHRASVHSVAWSPDGLRLVSGSSDETLRIWDAATGENLKILEGHGGAVRAVAWSPDGRRVVSAASDKTLRIWDTASGESLMILEGHGGAMSSVAWSPDGKQIVSGSSSGLRIWDAASGKTLQTMEFWRGDVVSVAWSPDGTQIVSGSGMTIRLWSAVSGELLQTLEGHQGAVYSVAWSPDGLRLASGSGDETLRIWDVASGESRQILGGHGDDLLSVAWSPDGTRVLTGSTDRTMRIWDAASGESLQFLEGHGGDVSSVAWSPDGTRIVSGADYRSVRIWDAANGWSQETVERHGQRSVCCVAWSPDGMRVASGADDSTLRIWDAASGECLQILEGDADLVFSVAWSPDGTRIAFGSSTLRIWDATRGLSLESLSGHGEGVWSVAWSPDGTRIVSMSGYGTLRIWDATSGLSLESLTGRGEATGSVAWSPDGTRIVSGSRDGSLRIWDAASGEILQSLEGHERSVTGVAWSPDGMRIVSSSYDKTIRIWDVGTGESLLTLPLQGRSASDVAWSPNGARIVVGSEHGSLYILESRLVDALPLWRAEHERQRVRPLVSDLFEEHILLEPVLAALDADQSLPDDLRDVALRVATSRSNPSAIVLNNRAWPLVDPDRDDRNTDLALGLRLARAAVNLEPGADLIDTLSWALLANGHYDEALLESETALELADQDSKEEYQGSLDRLRGTIDRIRSTETTNYESPVGDG